MAEWTPWIQLAGFAVTILCIVFYGGTLTEQLKQTKKQIDKVSESLFDENGIAEKTIRHEYHIQHVCNAKSANGRGI